MSIRILINNGDEMDIQFRRIQTRGKIIKDVVMLAARILLESGAEGCTRVEDTMTRIAKTLVTVKVTALLQTYCHAVLRYIRNRFLEYLELPLEIQT